MNKNLRVWIGMMCLINLVALAQPVFPWPNEQKKSPKMDAKKISQNAEQNAFNQKVKDFYKSEAVYNKDQSAQRTQLLKQLIDLRVQKKTATDEAQKSNIDSQIAGLNQQLEHLTAEMAKHAVESSQFGVTIAQHRLQAAQANLAMIESRREKTKKK